MNKNVHQGHLELVLRGLFPHEEIQNNVRKEANIKNPSTGYFLELDIWYPNLHLGFEFQDTYHYITTWDSHVSLATIQQKDSTKVAMMRKKGETLILVPCWWDGSPQMLGAEVTKYRPDLLGHMSSFSPISLNPPPEFFLDGGVPGVGELMLASFPTSESPLGDSIQEKINWWMGEKYDGVRFCWVPALSSLYSRSGGKLQVPECFYHHFPSEFLDGEAWFGRGTFTESQRLVTFSDVNWSIFRLVTFDVPNASAAVTPFEDRYTSLSLSFAPTHPFIAIATRMKSKKGKEIEKWLKEIIGDGGEGVVLRQPASVYHHGRSVSLFKLKAARGDKEALVVDVIEDPETAEVSLLLRLPENITFSAPNTGQQKPKRGDIVTFSYKSMSRRSVPVDPKVFRIREDKHWRDVLSDHNKDSLLNAPTNKALRFEAKAPGYWKAEKGKNMRRVMEDLAKDYHMDPLSALSWYSFDRSELALKKEVNAVLAHYHGSLINALIDLFPDVEFDSMLFTNIRKNHWVNVNNRREFFIELAKENNFDPFVAENWYNYSREDLREHKRVDSLLVYYNGSLVKGLIHMFPEIGLDPSKFANIPQNYWSESNNRKLFFERFASSNGFDPLIPKNWYSTSLESLQSFKGVGSIMYHYSGSLAKALLSLFPNIGLIKNKLSHLSKNYWDLETYRRRFFISFAKEKGFDPLIAKNWYSIPTSELNARKGASTLLCYHSSMTKALLELFPEIGLDKKQFALHHTSVPWHNEGKRRAFFERYATTHGFDPLIPENWYSVTLESFLSEKDANIVLRFHNGSIIQALINLFPELLWDQIKFVDLPVSYWHSIKNRRKFFEDFAMKKGFDSIHYENWVHISRDHVLAEKGGKTMLMYYGSVSKAVRHLFPEIKWPEPTSPKNPYNYWKENSNRRKFFLEIADSLGFDPLVPQNWYSLDYSSIFSHKKTSTVLTYYNGNLANALIENFPHIGLDRTKLNVDVQFKASKFA